MLEARVKKSIPSFNLKLDLTVNNEVVALFGPSGSGKSMTLQCLAGLIKPDAGSIIVNQRVFFDSVTGVNLPPQERRLGFVFQNYALFPHFTVEDNIAFGLKGVGREKIKEKVAVLLEKVKLRGLAKRYPHQLSGGQQQRVAMARALAIEPEVLLLDEPFSALDSQVKDQLERELLEMQQYFRGDVILITHNLKEAYGLSSKIAVYDAGEIIQYDDKDSIIFKPGSKRAGCLTGMRNFLWGKVVQVLANGGIAVETLAGARMICRSSTQNLVPGQDVCLGIRPEHIVIAQGGMGGNYLTAKLLKIERGITTTLIVFKVNVENLEEQEVYVEMPNNNEPNLKVEQEYSLYFAPQRLVLFTE